MTLPERRLADLTSSNYKKYGICNDNRPLTVSARLGGSPPSGRHWSRHDL